MTNLPDYSPVREPTNQITVPTFPIGDFGRAFYNDLRERVENKYKDVPQATNAIYNTSGRYGSQIEFKDGELTGSNPLLLREALEMLRETNPAFTIASGSQTESKEVRDMIRDRHYVDRLEIAVWSDQDPYEPNAQIASNLVSLVGGMDAIRENGPALVYGVAQVPNPEDPYYGIAFEQGEGFKVVHTPILNPENSGKRFNTTDSRLALPEKFVDDGDRIFYVKGVGVSRLVISGNRDLDADWGNFNFSNSDGRVVIEAA